VENLSGERVAREDFVVVFCLQCACHIPEQLHLTIERDLNMNSSSFKLISFSELLKDGDRYKGSFKLVCHCRSDFKITLHFLSHKQYRRSRDNPGTDP